MNWLSIASINLASGVALGAFGSHGLKNINASEYALNLWQTATLYLFVHAIGLLIIGTLLHIVSSGFHKKLQTTALLMQSGIVIFCGSLYLIALGLPKALGAITPIGGTLFIIAWTMLAIHGRTLHQHKTQSTQS